LGQPDLREYRAVVGAGHVEHREACGHRPGWHEHVVDLDAAPARERRRVSAHQPLTRALGRAAAPTGGRAQLRVVERGVEVTHHDRRHPAATPPADQLQLGTPPHRPPAAGGRRGVHREEPPGAEDAAGGLQVGLTHPGAPPHPHVAGVLGDEQHHTRPVRHIPLGGDPRAVAEPGQQRHQLVAEVRARFGEHHEVR
jgi:hypothetical protein